MPVVFGAEVVLRGAVVVGSVVGAEGVKEGWRMVEVVEEVIVRWGVGRRDAWEKAGGAGCVGCGSDAPSLDEMVGTGNGLLGDGGTSCFSSTSSGGDGVELRCRIGDSARTGLLASL